MLSLRSYGWTKRKISQPANPSLLGTLLYRAWSNLACFLLRAPMAIHFGCAKQLFGHEVFPGRRPPLEKSLLDTEAGKSYVGIAARHVLPYLSQKGVPA